MLVLKYFQDTEISDSADGLLKRKTGEDAQVQTSLISEHFSMPSSLFQSNSSQTGTRETSGVFTIGDNIEERKQLEPDMLEIPEGYLKVELEDSLENEEVDDFGENLSSFQVLIFFTNGLGDTCYLGYIFGTVKLSKRTMIDNVSFSLAETPEC